MEPSQYLDIVTNDGTLRVIYEMSIGDLLVAGMIALLLVFSILRLILRILWR